MELDLLNVDPIEEEKLNKLKRFIQTPNSYFMDVKCSSCKAVTVVFSHSATIVTCSGCNDVLCTPTGGKAKLVPKSAYKRKGD
mmetsp:Transcript_21128/g.24348  ORF Transcript_21128/g.24348 Transcript_21128/m.24348 type:complete len:83 (-) Transcript_21128:38-286(-)|eukprot:CAMPEP_0168339940 /NCGR_PEP_ID=MMETSP0213-20121227/13765_1 /TAXON_ID=151035 /ORGANISM="Euplotes harpa, Strain FSP1.4" /LENGTH=82 /DNA_ID=CAMNT_0008346077 /DNA_START=43 /DNA_END=291 /DNA_ORIENTATION=-